MPFPSPVCTDISQCSIQVSRLGPPGIHSACTEIVRFHGRFATAKTGRQCRNESVQSAGVAGCALMLRAYAHPCVCTDGALCLSSSCAWLLYCAHLAPALGLSAVACCQVAHRHMPPVAIAELRRKLMTVLRALCAAYATSILQELPENASQSVVRWWCCSQQRLQAVSSAAFHCHWCF